MASVSPPRDPPSPISGAVAITGEGHDDETRTDGTTHDDAGADTDSASRLARTDPPLLVRSDPSRSFGSRFRFRNPSPSGVAFRVDRRVELSRSSRYVQLPSGKPRCVRSLGGLAGSAWDDGG
jgi:hypothetical protein